MSQVNIIILVDVNKLLDQTTGATENTVKIPHPEKCIYMHDDRSVAIYNHHERKKDKSALLSIAEGGSLITWTILPSQIEESVEIKLKAIKDTTKYEDKKRKQVRLFNTEPQIFCASKRACATITDDVKTNKNSLFYSYSISFIFHEKIYYWDPFIPVRGEPI